MAPISVLDFHEELEYGLTDDFQIALYLNHHLRRCERRGGAVRLRERAIGVGDEDPRCRSDGDLVLVGMLLTGHVRFAWRARRNRGNGSPFLWQLRYSDNHWIRALLRRR